MRAGINPHIELPREPTQRGQSSADALRISHLTYFKERRRPVANEE